MSNVFKQISRSNEKSPRNNFDLSFQNHLTMKFGTLYPVFCKEVIPGDSFRIDSAFGLKFMPLVFPVQSGMRAHMHFFYCRNKNLWKNWENWIMNLEEHTHPFISQSPDFFKTGSLADYLDVPTTVVSTTGKRFNLLTNVPLEDRRQTITANGRSDFNSSNIIMPAFGDLLGSLELDPIPPISFDRLFNSLLPLASPHYFILPVRSAIPAPLNDSILWLSGANLEDNSIGIVFFHGQGDIDSAQLIPYSNTIYSITKDVTTGYYYITIESDYLTDINRYIAAGENVYPVLYFNSDTSTFPDWDKFISPNDPTISDKTVYINGLYADLDVSTPVDISENASTDIPYGTGSGQIRLNALPFRAYESIYQAYYRNTQNQDFIVNGEPVYNRYNTTIEDGADSTPYHLYQRNYELDFLTSAFPSPQQGNAPVIGMSALGNITLEDETGITTAKAEVGEDGDTIVGVTITSPNAPQGHRVALAELAAAGFTISSFREGNALTRWLEMNMRKGYRYLDFIQGHHNVRPKYNELDMPEFIGGYSRDVQVNTILNQTASPSSDPLGAFAGTANCFGGSNHSITHFCDDYGWIIGILCVTPAPAYSQLLPKHYLKYNPLDYYFNEFSQLGMQPITYEEVCPTQAWLEHLADNTKTLQDTFGYQRPNYDLVSYTDQVHGNFRTDLRNFLINRIFGNRPVLGSEFLQINPKEVNDIFAVTTPDDDVIAGQIVFRVHAKRPVPRVSIPSLGR